MTPARRRANAATVSEPCTPTPCPLRESKNSGSFRELLTGIVRHRGARVPAWRRRAPLAIGPSVAHTAPVQQRAAHRRAVGDRLDRRQVNRKRKQKVQRRVLARRNKRARHGQRAVDARCGEALLRAGGGTGDEEAGVSQARMRRGQCSQQLQPCNHKKGPRRAQVWVWSLVLDGRPTGLERQGP
eukprot:156346-Chlamydomonas_euryale.AAC.1